MIVLVLLPIVIVPVGVIYGLIAAGMLILRRRRAIRLASTAHAAVRPDAAAWTSLQRAERTLSVVLLCIAVVGGALALPIEIADAQHYTFNNESVRGDLIGLAGAIDGLLAIVLLGAVPIAAAITAMQIRRPDLLAAEAYALVSRTGVHRKIRLSRLLWWVTYTFYFVFGIAVVVATVALV